MDHSSEKLRDDALRIWHAGVAAVHPAKLIHEAVSVEGNTLWLGEQDIDLTEIKKIAVVGAGKAGAAMAAALEEMLGKDVLQNKQVTGWINVPADCLIPTSAIHLHAARPPGVNEPTEEGLAGTHEILKIVESLDSTDLCICLLSGGGSALLPSPIDGLSLTEKCDLIRELSSSGANIKQLNAVRRELSRVKGGGLARQCRAGRMVTLILSDVLGDDLETIASGPTVLREPTPDLALQVFDELKIRDQPIVQKAIQLLGREKRASDSSASPPHTVVSNLILGNNATAVDAAGCEAEKLGYSHAMISASESEGAVEQVAEQLAKMALSMRSTEGPDCLISGGEPSVRLCPAEERGLGGRNQQLALAMLDGVADWQGICFLSAGTDGEDGPTDAAGGIVDQEIADRTRELGLVPKQYLARNDAYHFFEEVDGLLKTGPTQTNVCDLRILIVKRSSARA